MFGFINTAIAKWKDFSFRLNYRFRKQIRWKRLNGIYLNISDELMSKAVCKYIFFGIYETDEHQILTETFNADDTLLELGTGIGYNTMHCARISSNRVTTFEGNPKLIPLIQKNMKKNSIDVDVRNEILVSKSVEETNASFNVAEEFWYSSVKEYSGANTVSHVSVPTRNINKVITEVDPTYLLVDIEGGEEELFEDCDFLIGSSVKKILIELHPWVIGDEKCNTVIKNILEKGFQMRMDFFSKHMVFFYKP